MITAKSAKKKMNAMKNAAVGQMGNITTNEKIAGAAAVGVVVGAAATAIAASLLNGNTPVNDSKVQKSPKV
ncbi:MAG: hypothetical protein WA793_06605 [Sphingorhabdus sp.]|uniref:hypothetical protein n=1 Tax=Sphingorhabdus sp. TaxID=1902408 RepID=UPI003CC148DC